MQDYPEARTWLKKDKIGNQDIKIRIFLVNAPLTFGHSQLIACFPKGTLYEESERFQLVAPFIKMALETFQQAFGRHAIHNKLELASLAKLTMTYGYYIKTLILRTSARKPETQGTLMKIITLHPLVIAVSYTHLTLPTKRIV